MGCKPSKCIADDQDGTVAHDGRQKHKSSDKSRNGMVNASTFEEYQPLTERITHIAYYDMGHRRRGIFIIINNNKFIKNRFPERTGSNTEVARITKTFKLLGFDVRLLTDLTSSDIMVEMGKVSKYDHSDCDCFGIFILTHGNEMNILSASKDQYYAHKLYKIFNGTSCPSLSGKPKLIFINACKGEKKDIVKSVEPPIVRRTSEPLGAEQHQESAHVYADFLCAFSTWEGYVSYRDEVEGSPYVSYVCQELEGAAHSNIDVLSALTRVALRMSNNPVKKKNEYLRQTSMLQSSLTKRLVLGVRN